MFWPFSDNMKSLSIFCPSGDSSKTRQSVELALVLIKLVKYLEKSEAHVINLEISKPTDASSSVETHSFLLLAIYPWSRMMTAQKLVPNTFKTYSTKLDKPLIKRSEDCLFCISCSFCRIAMSLLSIDCSVPLSVPLYIVNLIPSSAFPARSEVSLLNCS